MKAIDRAVTRFCYKHPNFGIRNLMLYIVAAGGVVSIVYLMDTTGTLLLYLHFDPSLILRGQVWRLVTFLFIPLSIHDGQSFIVQLLSLYFYYFIGSTLERQWGTARFNIYYFSGVLLNIIFGFAAYYIPLAVNPALAPLSQISAMLMTSEYLNLSLFFAFASIWPEHRVLLFFFIPVKMKWLAWIDAAFFAYSILSRMYFFPMNLLPLVAILNFFLFCWGNIRFNFRRDRSYSKRRGEFRSAIHQARDEERVQGYRHKCSVCGRTDVTNPELEFRYCSKCQGYHCFCQDHINNHIHFKE